MTITCIDCGCQTEVKSRNSYRCKACQSIADKKRKSWKNVAYRSAYDKPTKCICPLCRKEHTRLMQWTGHGTPRIYCFACLRMVEDYAHMQDFEHKYEVNI